MRRLVIRPGAIGDCLLALPAIEYLNPTELWLPSPLVPLFAPCAASVRSLSSTAIDLVGVGDLAPSLAFVSNVQSFDSVVSWYGANRPEFRDAFLQLGVPCQFHRALPPPGYQAHASDYFLSQVEAPLGAITRLNLPPPAKRETVVIHPFSGSPRKNWPLENYQQLASALPHLVDWSAGPEEQLPEATRFTSLYDLAQWIAGAKLYIGNDSGITHLAAATGVPTLALFGPTDPEVWAPRGKNVFVLRSDPITALSVDAVVNVSLEIVDRIDR